MDAISSTKIMKRRQQVARLKKFTDQRIGTLATPVRGVAYTYDTVAPSLALRVTAAGVRSFVIVKKINGTTHRLTLGRFPGLRLDDARQAARSVAGELARGDDPIASRKAARARKITLNDLWRTYLAHLKQRNRTWARDQERWNNHVGPGLGRRALVE
jgi:Arm DNA-binding domain